MPTLYAVCIYGRMKRRSCDAFLIYHKVQLMSVQYLVGSGGIGTLEVSEERHRKTRWGTSSRVYLVFLEMFRVAETSDDG